MTKLLKSVAIAAVLLAGASPMALAAKTAAAAPAAGTAGVNGIGVANLDAVVANSAAYKAGQAERDSVYKATIDAAKARQAQLEAQLRPLAEKFEKDRAAPGANPAALQQQYAAIQQIQEGGKQELEKILVPVRLSDAYVMEQINDKMSGAIQAAMTKNGVSLLLNPSSVQAASNAYNLNQAILAELDAALPSVSAQPPAGWLPREVRDQQAQQAARGTAAGSSDGR